MAARAAMMNIFRIRVGTSRCGGGGFRVCGSGSAASAHARSIARTEPPAAEICGGLRDSKRRKRRPQRLRPMPPRFRQFFH
ncbi:Hypothetical protein NTJ_15082 [Nesidiocoris tenuis]|uniref:Uncharacterized protein n=1 Tax=Nesidiocoris tenuis TaxID=355587 RepID=A0ABN7BDC7_9HEMI|nr:Hypothetical protein NTJ_15082 [Nesidiocoris tenuis]